MYTMTDEEKDSSTLEFKRLYVRALVFSIFVVVIGVGNKLMR